MYYAVRTKGVWHEYLFRTVGIKSFEVRVFETSPSPPLLQFRRGVIAFENKSSPPRYFDLAPGHVLRKDFPDAPRGENVVIYAVLLVD